jgi:hypothetical protein
VSRATSSIFLFDKIYFIICTGSDAALSVPIQLLSKALSVHSMNPSNLMACFIVKPGTDVGESMPPFIHVNRTQLVCSLCCKVSCC